MRLECGSRKGGFRWGAWTVLVLAALSFSATAEAFVHQFHNNLAAEALSETVPFTFDPNRFRAQDFQAVWDGPAIPGAEIRVGQESFEWVRVSEVFLLPRGRLLIELAGGDAGAVIHQGFRQTFDKGEDGKLRAQIPIALLNTPGNVVELQVSSGGKISTGKVRIRFAPRPEVAAQRLISDFTCSPYQLRFDVKKIPEGQWAFVGCRHIVSGGDRHLNSTLDVFVYWDGAPEQVLVDGLPARPQPENVWTLRLRQKPGQVRISSADGQQEMGFTYRIPDRLRLGFVGGGVGVYSYDYDMEGDMTRGWAPIVTLYGSYFFTETMRFVAFNATSIHKRWYADTGFYAHLEQFKVFDNRYQLKVMVGFKTLGFATKDSSAFKVSFPQGTELVIKDFITKEHDLSAGAFLFPYVGGHGYTNLWLRWGTRKFFGELNVIGWREELAGGEVYGSSSIGLTVGGPLFGFL